MLWFFPQVSNHLRKGEGFQYCNAHCKHVSLPQGGRKEKITEGSWRQKTIEEREINHTLIVQISIKVEIDHISHIHAL